MTRSTLELKNQHAGEFPGFSLGSYISNIVLLCGQMGNATKHNKIVQTKARTFKSEDPKKGILQDRKILDNTHFTISKHHREK